MAPRLTIFDCFSGLGGLSLGARMAGMKIVGGIDAEPAAVQVFRSAFPDAISLEHDLLVDVPSAILRRSKIKKGDIDVLVGGPPCQPYSINNHRRGLHDARCQLVDAYLDFVKSLVPQWIVMENVPGFASIENGKFLAELVNSLRLQGYFSYCKILNAHNFGVPQRRRRLILIASKNKNLLQSLGDDLENHTQPVITIRQAMGDLPLLPSLLADYTSPPQGPYQKLMRGDNNTPIYNHVASGLGEINLERIKHIPPGGNWRNIPRNLLPAGMARAKLSDHTTRYGRLTYDDLSYTLLTKCDPHWGCFLHPSQNRVLTVREAARIQSIPDYIHFPPNLASSYRLIGNAVPPLLSKGIMEAIYSKASSLAHAC